jgi:DNA polymerase epsilon subunit 1
LEQKNKILLEIPSLSEFPVVRMIANEQDNQYDARSSSWELFAASLAVQRQTHVSDWLARQISCSSFAQLPLANFSVEMPSQVSDVLFQRLLRRNGLVTWASDSSRPDLGGAEEDNNILLVDLENPEVSEPGCYDTVCIELSLLNLAICAILQVFHSFQNKICSHCSVQVSFDQRCGRRPATGELQANCGGRERRL